MPLPKELLDKELDMLDSIRPMMRAVEDMDTVLTLPLEIKTSDTPPTFIETAADYEIDPLPAQSLNILSQSKTVLPYIEEIFAVPDEDEDCLTWWAYDVADASQWLSIAMRDSWTGDGEGIQCAGFSMNTLDPICYAQNVLLAGGRNPRTGLINWRAIALLWSTSACRLGCILAVHERVKSDQILRAELLGLLCLLEAAGVTALKNHGTLTRHTVFMLSFTHDQARVIEARFTGPNNIAISIRPELDQFPAREKRDEAYKKLISWAMYVDRNNKDRYSVNLSVRSASTATTATTNNKE